ncbi:MAG: excinuclease ABC subunit UvrC [Promethearchaeota archaeon]
MKALDLQRKSLPHEPGVYLFKDSKGKVIYVGKAKDLKKRVSSYFLKTTYNDPFYEEKIKELVKEIHSIEYIVTENEKEALILENIQIKEHDPIFNVQMRDSKSYPWIAIFYSEKYPRINIIRNPHFYGENNLYLGPYTDKKEIQRILRDLRKIFPYCSCKKPIKKKKRPCLYYQLKLCLGPCAYEITVEEYMKNIRSIELFLKGETETLKDEIRSKMLKASENKEFEIAAYWRDKLMAIERSTTRQYILGNKDKNKDVVGFYSDNKGKYFAIIIIHIRDGRILNKSPFVLNLKNKVIERENVLKSILEQYYYQNTGTSLPDEIIVPNSAENFKLLESALQDEKENIIIREPSNDYEKGLIRISNKNAKVMVKQRIEMDDIKNKEEQQIIQTLIEAKDLLELPDIPRIIEGFDISNIEGQDATASMVYFLNGKPYSKNYRHYKIKSKFTPDDVAMMREVIHRRYSRLLNENKDLPDLILVDGGRGQLNAAVSVLEELGIKEIPVIGLAKRLEEIYIPGKKETIILSKNSRLLKLLQNIRDEAHRFALRLHKKQRKKKISVSVLEKIKGIGPVTKIKLLRYFGSVENIKNANLEELSEVVGKKLAEQIKYYFKSNTDYSPQSS